MKVFVLLACLSVAFALTPEHERRGRIWGGRQAAAGELPYMVGVLVHTPGIRTSYCGGSIVSSNFVLSAAHCFDGNHPATCEIGSHDRTLVSQFILVEQVIRHPLYIEEANDNDVALLRLARSITFTPTVMPVRLPNRRQTSLTFENQEARVSGWGGEGGLETVPVRFLRVGFSQVISQAACRIRFPNSASGSTLCIDGDTTSFCNGDFGGPVTVQDADGITTQIGIASFTNVVGCNRGFPAGFQRLTSFIEWIGANSDVVIRDDF